MIKVFLDSSACAKRCVNEEGSDAVEAMRFEADALGLSVLCVPEIVSALNRRLRERLLSPPPYRPAKPRLLDDMDGADSIALTPSVLGTAIRILDTSPVRAMDALRIACALEWGADIFATADARQLAGAKRAELKTRQ